MKRTQLSERRWNPRQGAALRVMLGDHDPPIHATTRNVSLGGMQLVTATKSVPSARQFMAGIEVERDGQRSVHPLPVRVVWSNNTSAGVEFTDTTVESVGMLREILKEARARYNRSHYPGG